MKNKINNPLELLSMAEFKRNLILPNISEFKSSIPRINLKKVKLSSVKEFNSLLKHKNITRVYLDQKIFSADFGFKRETKDDAIDYLNVNVLRKKSDKDDHITQITFNMEAQIANKEQKEHIIFSPSVVSMPPLTEDVVSTSGEELSWPPKEQKKKKHKAGKKKKKPYFLSVPEEVKPIENKVVEEETTKEQDSEKILESESFHDEEEKQKIQSENVMFATEQEESTEKPHSGFPWAQESETQDTLDSIFKGGLESELLDAADQIIEENKTKETSLSDDVFNQEIKEPEEVKKSEEVSEEVKEEQNVRYVRALSPEINYSSALNNATETIDVSNLANVIEKQFEQKVVDKSVKLKGKAGQMFGQFKISPITIAILGGAAATLGYLYWTYNSNNFQTTPVKMKKPVGSIFKNKHIKKETLEVNQINDKLSFQPIGEKHKEDLIQRAREAIESRVDPFGIESLPASDPVFKKMEAEEKETIEIQLQRKQIELVGVIGTEGKALGLLNIYTASYTAKQEDDELTRENALKEALGKAVPNRIEVSALDPVEDWYVKQINKSKARGDDPTVVLVMGNKQFTLKVGQKVLLPEDKTFEEIKAEIEAKEGTEDAAQKSLGLTP